MFITTQHIRGFLLLAAITVTCTAAQADIIEDFSSGLGSWTIIGDVSTDGNAAILGDVPADESALFTGYALGPGCYTIEFDFLNTLTFGDEQLTPDTFFASLYFANDLSSFDLVGGSLDDVLPMFDMDFTGVYNSNGTVEANPTGGWQHFAFNFSSAYQYTIATFELFDFDSSDGPGEVRLDNLSITARDCAVVPEPATMTLMALGLAAALPRMLRRKG